MFYTGRDLEVKKAYRDEMLRQADLQRTLRVISPVPGLGSRLYFKLMLGLGTRLEEAGQRMKIRYGATRPSISRSSLPHSGLQSC
ncbi:MAG: hypothetical protein ACK2TX_05155 [Anaerolineales bacterium]